jgi:hypothetical protein
MNKNEIIKLVSKLHYDGPIKRKFIQRLKTDLYARHQSFLSSPLLATMMLLTFDQFADIPQKIHLFYEQAFDTLFAKHDATKEAFKRKMHTQLPIDVFKKHLSYFCLASYYDEKFEFSKEEVLEYVNKGLTIEGANINPGDFLLDMTESVCTLQRDGLKYVFTHRSFQEFFAAYCLSRVTSKHVAEILPHVARRPTDAVIGLLYDMNSELVESEFILPQLSIMSKEIANITKERFLIDYTALYGLHIQFRLPAYAFSLGSNSDRYYFVEVLRNIYENEFIKITRRMKRYKRKDREVLSRVFKQPKSRKTHAHSGVITIVNGAFRWKFHDDAAKVGDADWFSESGLANFLFDEAQALSELQRKIERRNASKARAFDALIGIRPPRASA